MIDKDINKDHAQDGQMPISQKHVSVGWKMGIVKIFFLFSSVTQLGRRKWLIDTLYNDRLRKYIEWGLASKEKYLIPFL